MTTKKDLINMGKKIIFFSPEKFEKIFSTVRSIFFIPSLNERGVSDWNGLQCLIKDQKVENLKATNSEGAVTLEDGDDQGAILSKKDIEDAVSCGVNFLSFNNIDLNKVRAFMVF